MAVIVAADGKPTSENVLDYAFRYAKAFSEALYVLRVMTSDDEADLEKSIAEAHEFFNGLKVRAGEEGLEIHTLLEHGSAADSIIALAERLQASAIISGASDKSGLGRLMMEGVAERLVREADCAVIVVR